MVFLSKIWVLSLILASKNKPVSCPNLLLFASAAPVLHHDVFMTWFSNIQMVLYKPRTWTTWPCYTLILMQYCDITMRAQNFWSTLILLMKLHSFLVGLFDNLICTIFEQLWLFFTPRTMKGQALIVVLVFNIKSLMYFKKFRWTWSLDLFDLNRAKSFQRHLASMFRLHTM